MSVYISKKNEIVHGSKIKKNAESIWGWGTEAGRARAARRSALLIERGNLSQPGIILELGCGTGVFTSLFSRNKIEKLIAVDISIDLIKRAKDKQENSRVSFIVADIEKLPFKSEVMRAVVGVSVLHHLNINLAMNEIWRVLKNEGSLVFSEPNMLNPHVFMVKNIGFLKRIAGDVDTETAFFKSRISLFLRRNHFRCIVVKPFDFLHPAIPKRYVNVFEKIAFFLEQVPALKEIAGSLLICARKYI